MYTIETMKTGYSIRTVSQLTGLSGHVIRAWERRYGAVRPDRTESNQRTYSEADVKRLRLLAQAVRAGKAIGRVAGMPDRELEELVAQSREPDSQPADTSELVRSALEAVKRLDPSGLEQAIETAAVRLGQFAAIEQVIVPMMDEIGRGWHEGRMRIMHEHLASAVVRSFLGSALRASEAAQSDRGVVIAAPSGQFHELGALACAVAAGSLGMRVTYLGANVPADEILAAVDQTGSSAVVLSVVFPAGLTRVQEELSVLRRHLPEDVRLVVGGASAAMLGLEHAPRSMAELKDELAALLTGNAVLSSQPS